MKSIMVIEDYSFYSAIAMKTKIIRWQ